MLERCCNGSLLFPSNGGLIPLRCWRSLDEAFPLVLSDAGEGRSRQLLIAVPGPLSLVGAMKSKEKKNREAGKEIVRRPLFFVLYHASLLRPVALCVSKIANRSEDNERNLKERNYRRSRCRRCRLWSLQANRRNLTSVEDEKRVTA